MSAHTPGPWDATAIGEGLPLTRIGNALPNACGGFDSHCIALLAGTRTHAETSANALLIAAAPDLLAACLAYLADRAEAGCSADSAAVKKMRAAIAKATGESA